MGMMEMNTKIDELRKEVEKHMSLEEHLRHELSGLRLRCVPGAEKAFDLKMYGCLKIVPVNTPTYAYWIEEPDRERHWHCSNCSKVQGIASVAMKYCPECGAKMIEHPWAGSGCGQAFSPD